MDKKEETLLIHAPLRREEVVTLFPVIQNLKMGGFSNVILAIHECNKFLVEYLDFEQEFFVLPKDYADFLDAHKVAALFKSKYNFDTYFDFQSNSISAFLGQNLGIVNRYGFKSGFSSLLSKKTVERTKNIDESALLILKSHEISEIKSKIMGKGTKLKVDEVFIKKEDVPDYILIYLNELKFLAENGAFFINFFNEIQGIKFRFIYEARGDLTLLLHEIKELNEKFNKSNQYEYGEVKDSKFVIDQIINSKGVISDQEWPSLVANYYGVNAISLNSELFINPSMFVSNYIPFKITPSVDKILSRDGEILIQSFIDMLHKNFSI